MPPHEKILEGWGRYPRILGTAHEPRHIEDLAPLVQRLDQCIARGNGRSYGDSSFSKQGTVSLLRLNRLLDFDAQTGEVETESGVLLSDVIDCFLPLGWFPPVTPGTKFVTIGGMIASNVHGKNAVIDGAFGDHVLSVKILLADGTSVECSRLENADLFQDTIGGMGLTGIIQSARFKLKQVETGWMSQTRTAHENLRSVMDQFEATESATYRVAWIDVLAKGKSLGRSILDTAEHAKRRDLPSQHQSEAFVLPRKRVINVPFAPPFSPLNKYSVSVFNALRYRSGRSTSGDSLVDWNSYFYPLDSILNWNRIYGRSGFAQYQCVLPKTTAYDGLVEILEAISDSGRGSFLAVLKRLGDTYGSLSFPMDGYTLALDFPWSPRTERLLNRLDELTLKYKGRVYLAKDSRISANLFHDMHSESSPFAKRRRENLAADKFNSLQSLRLKI